MKLPRKTSLGWEHSAGLLRVVDRLVDRSEALACGLSDGRLSQRQVRNRIVELNKAIDKLKEIAGFGPEDTFAP